MEKGGSQGREDKEQKVHSSTLQNNTRGISEEFSKLIHLNLIIYLHRINLNK